MAMREQRPLMVVWKNHAYVLTGVIYDEFIGPNNARILELKELTLADPATTESVSFVREHDDSQEIKRCYELGCNVYITKPVNYESFANAIRQLGLFFSVIQVPPAAT